MDGLLRALESERARSKTAERQVACPCAPQLLFRIFTLLPHALTMFGARFLFAPVPASAFSWKKFGARASLRTRRLSRETKLTRRTSTLAPRVRSGAQRAATAKTAKTHQRHAGTKRRRKRGMRASRGPQGAAQSMPCASVSSLQSRPHRLKMTRGLRPRMRAGAGAGVRMGDPPKTAHLVTVIAMVGLPSTAEEAVGEEKEEETPSQTAGRGTARRALVRTRARVAAQGRAASTGLLMATETMRSKNLHLETRVSLCRTFVSATSRCWRSRGEAARYPASIKML